MFIPSLPDHAWELCHVLFSWTYLLVDESLSGNLPGVLSSVVREALCARWVSSAVRHR